MKPFPKRVRAAVPVRGPLLGQDEFTLALLAGLRDQLRAQYLSQHGRELSARWVDHALNEAEAVAAAGGLALLVLPELAREKVAGVLAWNRRQAALRQRGALSFGA